jgi:hypothetical protein
MDERKFLKKLNGARGDSTKIGQLLATLSADRQAAANKLASLQEQRREALLNGEFELAEQLEAAAAKVQLEVESLGLREPVLRRELGTAQGDERQRAFERARQQVAVAFEGWADDFLELARRARQIVTLADQMPGRDGAVSEAVQLCAFIGGWSEERLPGLQSTRAALRSKPAAKRTPVASPSRPPLRSDGRPVGSLQHAMAMAGGVPITGPELAAKTEPAKPAPSMQHRVAVVSGSSREVTESRAPRGQRLPDHEGAPPPGYVTAIVVKSGFVVPGERHPSAAGRRVHLPHHIAIDGCKKASLTIEESPTSRAGAPPQDKTGQLAEEVRL